MALKTQRQDLLRLELEEGWGQCRETQEFLPGPFLGGIHTAKMSRSLLDGHCLALECLPCVRSCGTHW